MTTSTQNIDATQLGMAVDGALSITMSRRRLLRLLGTAGAVAVVAGVARATPAAAGPSAGSYVTTSDLNLRAKPKSTAKVLLVMPKGANVEEIGGRKNGYLKVRYNGKAGWAFEEFLRTPIKPSGPSAGPDKLTTTSDLNHRAKASTSAKVLSVIPAGVTVGDQGESANGFRKVSYSGAIGWCSEAYLA